MTTYALIDNREVVIDFLYSAPFKYCKVFNTPDDPAEVEIISVVYTDTGEDAMGLVDTHEYELTGACFNEMEAL